MLAYPSSASSAKTIYSLPDDVLLLIVSYIYVKDIISLRKTSKKFYNLTKLRWVWSDAVKRHVIDRGLPVPAASTTGIKALSAQHLESRAVHAAKFNDNWYSPHPKPRGAIEFSLEGVEPDGTPASVRKVLFLKGRSGEFLVTLARKTIECWEVPLDGSGAYRIAEWTDEHGIEQLLVNEDPNHPAEIAYVGKDALDPNHTCIYTLSLDTFHGTLKPRCAVRGTRQHLTPVHIMHGDYIVMGDPLVVWHTMAGPAAKPFARLVNEAHINENHVLAVKILDQHLMAVRTKSVEMYQLPIWSSKENRYTFSGRIVSALAIDNQPAIEAAIVVRSNTAKDGAAMPPSDERSPVPVTVLLFHHLDPFHLHTLTQLDFVPRVESKTPSRPGNNGPLLFPVESTRTYKIAPSSCHLTVSSGGKGFWVQTHNVTNRHNQYPARCVMGFGISPPEQDIPRTSSKSYHPEVVLLKENKAIVDQVNDLQLCKGQLYARRCDMSEILRRKYSLVTADLDDTVGRIAIGDRCGKIEVLDYV